MDNSTQQIIEMSSSRPYMIRAIHAWITDNALTPYIVVDAENSMATVPEVYIKDGQIILNCSYNAAQNFSIDQDWISFSARFSGTVEHISFPSAAVKAIYAQENGQGMIFQEEDSSVTAPESANSETAKRKRPALTLVK